MKYSVLSIQIFKKKIKCIITFLALFFAINISFGQYDIPEKPNFIPPVIDSTKTLNTKEYELLYNKLQNYNDSTSTEVLIVIIPTTKGENIGLLAPKWGHKWGIGQEKEDNGVFILLAKDDRKLWISPGYGVEHRLTAGINGEIIRNVIIPEFQRDDYYSGLNNGLDAIFQVLSGEYVNNEKPSFEDSEIPFSYLVILVFVLIFIIISISHNKRGGPGGRNGGNKSFSGSLLDAIILSNMGRGSYGSGSGGFGGGSSGGFGGFGGGGGFSGGGSGGSW